MKTRRRPIRQRGVTLIETLIASAILAFAVAAISQSISVGQMQTYAALHEQRGIALVETMIEEIHALDYADPEGQTTNGPDTGETSRALFDNCDDFHGYSEAVGACADAGGTSYGGKYAPFLRSVTCAYGTVTIAEFGDPIDGLNVTVTVSDGNGLSWSTTRFILEP
jgi:prepilin-type N-terminal cleavage/methylation domain-containing protein